MERPPDNRDQEATGPNRQPWRARVEADLTAYAAEQQRLYGGIDELALARYEAGSGTAEERARVEQALRDHPALRECLETSRDFAADREIAPADAARRKREGGDRADRPGTPPGASR